MLNSDHSARQLASLLSYVTIPVRGLGLLADLVDQYARRNRCVHAPPEPEEAHGAKATKRRFEDVGEQSQWFTRRDLDPNS